MGLKTKRTRRFLERKLRVLSDRLTERDNELAAKAVTIAAQSIKLNQWEQKNTQLKATITEVRAEGEGFANSLRLDQQELARRDRVAEEWAVRLRTLAYAISRGENELTPWELSHKQALSAALPKAVQDATIQYVQPADIGDNS